MTEAMLSVTGLDVAYGGIAAVRDLSFEVGRGEIVGLIGPNGAGKSTTLNAIMGLVAPRAGDIQLAGTSILGRKPEDVARSGIALVPEGRRIFADLTVEENLRLGYAARRGGESADADTDAVFDLFPIVKEFRSRHAGALSGGQQQQLAIARRARRAAPMSCCSTSLRSGSRRPSSTSSSRRSSAFGTVASPSFSSSSAPSERLRSPTGAT